MKFIYALLAVSLLAGCGTAALINDVSLGMTKKEVKDTLGEPDHTKAREGVEVLSYSLSDGAGIPSEYWIVLKDGKVTQYGRAGDFGSAQNPVLEIKQNVKVEKAPASTAESGNH